MANRFGCRPSEDVCLVHCEPLIARDHCAEGKDVAQQLPQQLNLSPSQWRALAEEGKELAAEFTKRGRSMHRMVDYRAESEAWESRAKLLKRKNQELQQELAIWKLSHFWGQIFSITLWDTPCTCGHRYEDHEYACTSECFHSSDYDRDKDCSCVCYQADVSKSTINRLG
jgi:hypothetical protein